MGQYYRVVNIDKREYIHPHRCGDGLKLMEFGLSGQCTMACLAVLLADGNGRGGGDLRSDNPIVGSWAGDRIVIAGDYADSHWGCGSGEDNLYSATDTFNDISHAVMRALCDDAWLRARLQESSGWTLQQLGPVLGNSLPANPIEREAFNDAEGYVQALLDRLPPGLFNHLRVEMDRRENEGHIVEQP